MSEELEAYREQHQETRKDHLCELLEERLLRHVAESESRLRAEMQAACNRQQDQLARQQEQIADMRKQSALRTRWIPASLGVAAVLFPVIQRLMEATRDRAQIEAADG